jgi:hypothetical protein
MLLMVEYSPSFFSATLIVFNTNASVIGGSIVVIFVAVFDDVDDDSVVLRVDEDVSLVAPRLGSGMGV